MNSTNSSAVPAAPGAWLPATFTPMFQNSVLTAGTVTFIYLILTVFGQVQYVERKGGSPTMFYLLIWVLFCGILKGLTSRPIYLAYYAVTLALWLVVVVTFIVWNIAGYRVFVIPGLLCAPLFPLDIAFPRSFEIVICIITTTVFFVTLHCNTKGMASVSASAKKIKGPKIKSVTSAIFTYSVIIIAAAIRVADATWQIWAPYNITLIVFEMMSKGCSLVYSNKCEIGSDNYSSSSTSGSGNHATSADGQGIVSYGYPYNSAGSSVMSKPRMSVGKQAVDV